MASTICDIDLEEKKRAAWQKAETIPGYDPDVWRRDADNTAINYQDFGRRGSRFGWELDVARPGLLGGRQEPANLRARHWRNRRGLRRWLR